MQSKDGGVTWERMDGTELELPVVADETGKSQLISLEEEFDEHTWLAGFLVRAGKEPGK